MLSECFYWIFNMSILGALCGLAVLVLRKIKAIPRFAVYLLWAVPLARFLLPIGVGSRFSLLNLLSGFLARTVAVSPGAPWLSASNLVRAADSYFPIVYRNDTLTGVFRAASAVWAVLAAAAILTAVTLYCVTIWERKGARRIKENLYRSSQVAAPAVYGIIRPKIILPEAMDEGALPYILLHEQVHIRRRDNLWRMLAVLTACVHWFNPLVWVFLKAFFADMELACDAGVMKETGRPREYAAAVLSAASGKTMFASAFGGAKVRLRVENILSYKKLTVLSGVCTALLLAAVAAALLTNAR